jgi:hypothetical protein
MKTDCYGPHKKGPDSIQRTEQDLALNSILNAHYTSHLNTNMKAILLGCETWKNSSSITAKLQVFINKCLRQILRIFWLDQITNNELWKRTKQPRIGLQIRKCKWGWLGHTLRKPYDDIVRQALEWNPQGKRGRGRPRNTWWTGVFEEAIGVKKTWAEIKSDAKNRMRQMILVQAPCSTTEWWDNIYIYIHTHTHTHTHKKTDIHLWSFLIQFFLEWKMLQTKFVLKIKQTVCSKMCFCEKSCHFWDSIE